MERKLHETENVWKPACLCDSPTHPDETAELYKKVRGLLNKLTPQNFHKLIWQLQALPIDSSWQLCGVVDLVFDKVWYVYRPCHTCRIPRTLQFGVLRFAESQPCHPWPRRVSHGEARPPALDSTVKTDRRPPVTRRARVTLTRIPQWLPAVSEPTYSAVHAQVCKSLSGVWARAGGEVSQPETFRKLLLRRCRHEFEDNWQADPRRDELLEEIERCSEVEKKKELQLELEEVEMQIRLKAVAFIKFVGEMFKVGILTRNVMHRYIQGFLKHGDEVSLECLCGLLTAVGEDLDTTKRPTIFSNVMPPATRMTNRGPPAVDMTANVPGQQTFPQHHKEEVKQKEAEKEIAEGEENIQNEQNVVTNVKVSAAVLEEEEKDEAVENTPPESVLTVPEQICRKDLWSQFNPDGQKKYERDFLIKLRDTTEAKKKPEVCSDVLNFLLKDKINRPRPPDPSKGAHGYVTDTRGFRGGLSKYFEDMKVLSKQCGQISSRVRFMLQDVIELRDNKWVSRRDTYVPNFSLQIQRKPLWDLTEMKVPFRVGCGIPVGGAGKRNRGVPSEDERQSVHRKYSDTSKLRIKASDLINVSLGGSNQFAAWTQRAGGNSDSDSEHSSAFPQMIDTVTALQDVEVENSGEGLFSRLYGKQPHSSNPECEKAVKSLRNFVSAEKEEYQPRMASSGTPSRLSSCEGSSARQTPASTYSQSSDDLAAVAQLVASDSSAVSDQDMRKNLPHLTRAQVAKKIQFILEEFVNNNNYQESALSVSETFAPSDMGNFVVEIMNVLLERTSSVRSNMGKLMAHLMKEGILTTEQFLVRFKEIAEVADDLASDVPKVWLYLAEILVAMLSTEALSFADLKIAATGLHKLVIEILHLLVKDKGPGWIRQRWDVAGMSWKDFAPADSIDRIVKENKLEFTVGPAGNTVALTLQSDNGAPATTDEVAEWISCDLMLDESNQ